jgi:hypothetical protein
MARKTMWVGEGELARVWKIAHNTMFGVVIQNLCEITVMAEKAGIPRHVFLESINDSVVGSMYTRYKTPMLTNLTFDQVTFTPKLLLKDMDLGLGAAKAYGVPALKAGVILGLDNSKGSLSAISFLKAYPTSEMEVSIPALMAIASKASSIADLVNFFSNSPLDGLKGETSSSK